TAFRILALDPGRDDDPLQGELIDADIQSPRCPSFVTLSYVWGVAKYERPFLCRSGAMSGKILITASLEQALKQFRLRHGTLYTWTDGVCIDQMNMEERNQQVKLMGQIYRSADQVIVWLG
ncbi:heterokaryon incompatibility protein-domain-containing protein, partial [Pyrenochaeta sp. MPI-SDFR-AT-0127]